MPLALRNPLVPVFVASRLIGSGFGGRLSLFPSRPCPSARPSWFLVRSFLCFGSWQPLWAFQEGMVCLDQPFVLPRMMQ